MAQQSDSATAPHPSTDFSRSGFHPRLRKCSRTMTLTSPVSFCKATGYSSWPWDKHGDFLWLENLCLYRAHSSRDDQESLTPWCSKCTEEVCIDALGSQRECRILKGELVSKSDIQGRGC